MPNTSISEFFKQKAKRAQPPRDWRARKKAFVNDVEALYRRIAKYLKGAGPAVSVEYSDTMLREPHVGEYPVREMLLRVGDERVVFTPKGINIFGAAGRVDVRGERGDGMLVLQPRHRWCVVKSTRPTLHVVDLTEKTLGDLLQEIMRP